MGYMVDLEEIIGQSKFGYLVGISQPAVSGLVARGVLKEGGTLRQWLLDYTGNLREQAAGRASSGDLDLVSERARLAKAQADGKELENAVKRDEYAPYHLLTQALAQMSHEVVSIMEALPVKLKKISDRLTAEDLDLIEREIVKARNAAADVRLRDGDLDTGDDLG